MLRKFDGSCAYCVEGLIARILNLPEYEYDPDHSPGRYAFGDPETESVDIFSIGSKVEEAGFPSTLSADFVLSTLKDLPDNIAEKFRICEGYLNLNQLNDAGITFQQFAILFEALGIPRGNSAMDD